jgi:hypothetical protein
MEPRQYPKARAMSASMGPFDQSECLATVGSRRSLVNHASSPNSNALCDRSSSLSIR